ncbi:MAG: hypothetical protein V3T83_12900, partial [Acidobacteriota bacterium]
MRPKAFAVWLTLGFLLQPLWAMQEPPPSNPSRPNTGTAGQPPAPGSPAEPRLDMPRILYISGKVMMEDGTPPPEALTVDLVCNGQIFQQVQTRSKGQFDFELGNRNAFAAIGADVRGPNTVTLGQMGSDDPFGGSGLGNGIRASGLGRYDLTGCTVRLSPLPGYASNTISLGFRSIFDRP